MALIINGKEKGCYGKSTTFFLAFLSFCIACGTLCIALQTKEIEKLKQKIESLEKILSEGKPCDPTPSNDSEIQPN